MSQKLRVASIDSQAPEGATILQGSSGNVANASGIVTLTCPAGKTAYLGQFTVTAAGATAGAAVSVTVTGLLGGTQTYTFTFPTGATVGAVPLDVDFAIPQVGAAIGTNIVITLPAGGAGNTNAAVSASGFAI